MRVTLLFIIIAIMGSQVLFGQSIQNIQNNKWADTILLERVKEQLIEELRDIPVSVKRIAFYRINYDSHSFKSENIDYIKSELESIFRDNSSVLVVSPQELDPTDKMKISGSDSSLQVMNIKGRSLADLSPEMMETISGKYSVSGLVELTLQKNRLEGLMTSIRIVSPQSREVVWSKSFVSYPLEAQKDKDRGNYAVLNFGASALTNEAYKLSNDLDTEIEVGTLSLMYNLTYGYRQPLNDNNSSYLGIYTGVNIIRPIEDTDFENIIWEVGLSFDQALSKKNDQINDYRFMLGLDTSVWFSQGNKTGDLIVFSPSLMFNLTKNIGFELSGFTFLGERSVRVRETSNTYIYGQLGYGVKAYVRF